MEFEKQMMEALSALLKRKEQLQATFYGVLRTGSLPRPKEYYCLFGFTGEDLLIVSYSPLFKRKGFSVRVPLHIRQVKIQESLTGGKYTLRFRLNDAWRPFEKFKIVVKKEHSKLESQKENVEKFLSVIEEYNTFF